MVVPFTPITLVCRDIHYYVPDPSKGEAPGVVKDSGDQEVEGKLELLKVCAVLQGPRQRCGGGPARRWRQGSLRQTFLCGRVSLVDGGASDRGLAMQGCWSH